jgi:SPP1 family predicted phage head-tail adaptor
MITLGKYDQKVLFRSYQNVSDGFGGTVPTATTILSTFARAIQMKGTSTAEQAQLMLPNTYKIGVLIRTGFQPSTNMVVLYRSKEYKIVGVEKRDERQAREWVITIVGDGD